VPPVPADAQEFLALERQCERLALQGQHREGLALAGRLLELAAPLRAPEALGQACRWQALHALRLGLLQDCLQAAQNGLRALSVGRQHLLRSHLHCSAALACAQASLYPDALVHADQALREADLARDPQARAWALNRLGTAHVDLGDPERGRQLLQESLEEARRLQDAELEFAALNNLGSHLNWRMLGRAEERADAAQLFARALEQLQQARAVAERLGQTHALALAQVNLAWAWRENGQLQAALAAAEQADALAAKDGLVLIGVHARIERALTLVAQGEAVQAHELLLSLDGLVQPLDGWSQLSLCRALAAAQRALGRFEDALHTLEKFHRLAMQEARIRSELHLHLLKRQHELDLARQQAQRARLEAEMQRLRAEQLRREAHEDALTGLYNRRFVDEQLPVLRERSLKLGRPLLALMVDADHFKGVNDAYGHRVGDEALRRLGALLLRHTRVSDLAARMGGEELLLLLPDTPFERAREVAERIRHQVECEPWDKLAPGMKLTVSAGLAVVGEGSDPLGEADAALYRAKAAGRNCICAQTPTGS